MALPLARPSRRRHDPMNPRKSNTLLIVMILYALYTLVPLVWLLFSSTKTQAGLFSSFGLWFADDFAFIDNLVATFSYRDGIFLRWLGNTLLYVVVGAGGATLLATMAGYGLAKFRFPGRRAVFAVVLGAVAVPGTALAVPTFLLFSELGLTNTPWAVIIPSLISPFGLYLIWVFASESVPTELLEAARIDGAGEWRTFSEVMLPLAGPSMMVVMLTTFLSCWQEFTIAITLNSHPAATTLAVGITYLQDEASSFAFGPLSAAIMLAIAPLLIAFLFFQRKIVGGLAEGALKG